MDLGQTSRRHVSFSLDSDADQNKLKKVILPKLRC